MYNPSDIVFAKQPPLAAFPSPSGVPFSAAFLVLKLPLCYESSEYVLSFEIGQREDGLHRALTDTPSSEF